MNAIPRIRPALAALVAAGLLSACGAKGPLFLPPPEDTQPALPAPAPEPAAPATDPTPQSAPTPAANEP